MGGDSFKVNRSSIQNSVEASLYLIKVQNIHLYLNEQGKRKINFTYKNVRYNNFSCTDPNFDSLINNQNEYNEAILCLSLGELFQKDNCHYKIVASIFL